MGSPSSEKEMKIFLKRMFRDKAIMNAPTLIRYFLSLFISQKRYKKSWEKYHLIGGSPLFSSMNQIKQDIANQLNNDWLVSCAYSYSEPLIAKEIERYCNNGITNFTVLPMYPQASFSTTGSLNTEIKKARLKFKNIQIRLIEEYFQHPGFIDYWTNIIFEHTTSEKYVSPHLLFSAHSIPQTHTDKGDTYTQSIELSAKLIAEKLGFAYSVSYQSKIGKVQWSEPDTMDELFRLQQKGVEEIVLVPISFVNENLETVYDLDMSIIPFAQQIGINKISRVKLQTNHPLLIHTFLQLIEQ